MLNNFVQNRSTTVSDNQGRYFGKELFNFQPEANENKPLNHLTVMINLITYLLSLLICRFHNVRIWLNHWLVYSCLREYPSRRMGHFARVSNQNSWALTSSVREPLYERRRRTLRVSWVSFRPRWVLWKPKKPKGLDPISFPWGPWLRSARMREYRTPMHLTSVLLEIPCMSPRTSRRYSTTSASRRASTFMSGYICPRNINQT